MDKSTLPILPKKRGRKPKEGSPTQYFGEREELAVKEFLTTEDRYKKSKIFEDIIEPALRELVKGVRRMPKFQKMIGLNEEYLLEDAYYHVIENMHKFVPGRIGKSGQPVKAYSYYGTIIKNFYLQTKKTADKSINEHGGMLDVDDLMDHIPERIDRTPEFEELKAQLLVNLERILATDKKLNQNDLVVGNALRYMLTNWHKLDFQKKNEFMRILAQYTHLKAAIIARSLKKLKILTYDNFFNPPTKKKKQAKKKSI